MQSLNIINRTIKVFFLLSFSNLVLFELATYFYDGKRINTINFVANLRGVEILVKFYFLVAAILEKNIFLFKVVSTLLITSAISSFVVVIGVFGSNVPKSAISVEFLLILNQIAFLIYSYVIYEELNKIFGFYYFKKLGASYEINSRCKLLISLLQKKTRIYFTLKA